MNIIELITTYHKAQAVKIYNLMKHLEQIESTSDKIAKYYSKL